LLAVDLLAYGEAAASVISAKGHWAALTFDKRCEARARPLRVDARGASGRRPVERYWLDEAATEL
jgi:hypothetical protein